MPPNYVQKLTKSAQMAVIFTEVRPFSTFNRRSSALNPNMVPVFQPVI